MFIYIYIIGVQINTCYRRSTSKEVSGYTTSTSSLKMTTHNITFLAVPAPKELQTAKKIQLLYSRDTNVIIMLYFWCASYLRSFIRNYLVLLFMMHSLSYNKIVNWGERTQLMWLLDFIVGWLQWSDYSLTVHLPAHLWGWIFVKCSNTDPPFSLYDTQYRHTVVEDVQVSSLPVCWEEVSGVFWSTVCYVCHHTAT